MEKRNIRELNLSVTQKKAILFLFDHAVLHKTNIKKKSKNESINRLWNKNEN